MKMFSSTLLLLLVFLSNSIVSAQQKKISPKKTSRIPTVKKVGGKALLKKSEAVKDTSVTRIKIYTDFGVMVVSLYNKTPKHRDNFIKLVKDHVYDSLLFHRVINSFMIQGGDPDSKYAEAGILLGQGGLGYTIPAELDSTLYHKKGALCAARTDNPEKASSSSQFYIVQGKTFTDTQLDMIAKTNKVYFSPARRMTYKMIGGTPHLDTRYTVFGQVETGLDVVDKIAGVPRDANNRPLHNIRMRMEIISIDADATTIKKNPQPDINAPVN